MTWRATLRRDVVLSCLVVLMADVSTGILSPTFSVFARGIGASLALIGVLGSAFGVGQIVAALPIGHASDRVGRRAVLSLGMVGWSAAVALIAITTNPYWLLPTRVLYGMCWIATYAMAVAHLGDVVSPRERGVAFGLLTTAMGVGFTVGPLLGAAILARHGIRASYFAAAAVALAGGILAATGLRPGIPPAAGSGAPLLRQDWGGLWRVLRDPSLRAASLGSLMINLSFNAAVVNFFPLYATQLQVPQTVTNSMFAARATGSTVSRFPAGILIARVSSWTVLVGTLVLLTVVVFALGLVRRPDILAVLLGIEGITFGIILTADQALTAEISPTIPRGSAIGVYSLTGSVGTGVGPAALGLVAQHWGLQAVFDCTGIMILAGLVAAISLRGRHLAAQASPVSSRTRG